MEEQEPASTLAAFALIYLTFFLDNVLLTVLVPIIPDWVRGGEALEQWTRQDAPLAVLLNTTMHQLAEHTADGGIGRAQATVGLILGAKAAVQLGVAGPAASAVCRYGPAKVLHFGTAMLAAAALVFWLSSISSPTPSGLGVVLAVGCGRAVHGAGAALTAVAGLALAARGGGGRALPVLLGAVALGVLVGYPFGGIASALWRPGVPFLLIAAVLLLNLGLQSIFLNIRQFNLPAECPAEGSVWSGWGAGALRAAARRGAGACAGCVLLTTSVMAALEPVLPLWLSDSYGAARWQTGLAFIPDSAGYFLATSTLGGVARRFGPERVALTGQITVGVSAMCLPLVQSAWGLAGPQLALGCGLGAVDAALVPALLARAKPRTAAARAALLQSASSAAYVVGPCAGGGAAWACGARAALASLGAANLLYAAVLYRLLRRYPLSEQWGANAETDSEDEETELAPMEYSVLRETTLR